jgi:pimeloyl-ACP methyl ester carboxylesterase
MSQVIINNLVINYKILGSGRTNLLLLHGWGCDLNIFKQLIQKFNKNKYTIYFFDFPGFGKSQLPKDVWGVGEYAAFLKQFLEKLQINKAIILGHSFGGRVAIKFASEYSQRVQKLILVGCAGIKKKLPKSYLMAVKAGKAIFKLPFLKKYKNKVLGQIGARDLASSGAMQEIFKKVVNEDLRPGAKKISAPTLLIYGINDQETPVEYGQIFNKLIPNSKLRVIKNAGHYVFLDQPDDFLAIMENFEQDKIKTNSSRKPL